MEEKYNYRNFILVLLVGCLLVGGYMWFTRAHAVKLATNETESAENLLSFEDLLNEDGKIEIQDFPIFDPADVVSVGDYTHLEDVNIPVIDEIDDEDIDNGIVDYIAFYDAYDVVTEGTVEKGDTIVASYTGYFNGRAVDDYTVENNMFILGEASEPQDFVDAVDGAAIGETLSFDVTFEDDWPDTAYAGKTLQFEAVVQQKNVIPTVTNENVSDITGGAYDDVADFRAYVAQQLTDYAEETADNQLRSSVWAALLDTTELKDVPKDLLVWDACIRLRDYQDQADLADTPIEEYLVSVQNASSIDEVMAAVSDMALEDVKMYAAFCYIADAEQISIDTENPDDELILASRKSNLMQSFSLRDEAVVMEYYKQSNLMNDALDYKVMNWLVENVRQASGS